MRPKEHVLIFPTRDFIATKSNQLKTEKLEQDCLSMNISRDLLYKCQGPGYSANLDIVSTSETKKSQRKETWPQILKLCTTET